MPILIESKNDDWAGVGLALGAYFKAKKEAEKIRTLASLNRQLQNEQSPGAREWTLKRIAELEQ